MANPPPVTAITSPRDAGYRAETGSGATLAGPEKAA